MTKNVIAAIGASIRALLAHIPALVVLGVLYALFIGACYFFITTREASAIQVLFTFVFAVAIPVLFFALQAGCAGFAVGADSPGATLRSAGKAFWKLLLVSLPLVLGIVLCVWLLNKVETRITAMPAPAHEEEAAKKPKVHWSYVLLVTFRLLLFGIVVPLILIHLWLGIARNGLRGMFKGFGRVLAPQTVLTYAVGMIIFGVIPYFLLFTRTGTKGEWSELLLFGVRLLLAFLFCVIGWVWTMRALAARMGTPTAPAPVEPDLPPQPAQA